MEERFAAEGVAKLNRMSPTESNLHVNVLAALHGGTTTTVNARLSPPSLAVYGVSAVLL